MGRLRNGLLIWPGPPASMTTSALAFESPATLRLSSALSSMRTSTTRASMSATGSLLKTTLRLTTRSLRTTSPVRSAVQRGNADLGLLAELDLADVLLVDLGDRVHDFGVADFDDSLVAHALARPDVDAQDLPFDRRAHFGRLEVGTRQRQAGLGLDQLGLGDLDVGRADRLQGGEIGLGLIERVARLAHI